MTELLPIGAATGPALRQLAAVCDAPTRAIVESVLGASGAIHYAVIDGGIDAATAFIAAAAPPELVLADISDSRDPLASIDALAEQCTAGTPVIVVGDCNDIGLYRALIGAGVSEYLVKPLDPSLLGAAIAAALTAARSQSGAARVVVLIGARGGVGTTTVAVSAGWTLAATHQQRVVLLDIDLQFGSMALMLDLVPGNGLRELLAAPDRIDSTLIAAALLKPTGVAAAGDRLALLGGEVPLEAEMDVTGDSVAALVAGISTSADVIIVELPRTLNVSARTLMRTADSVAIVTDTDLVGLRDTQRLLRLVAGLRAGARPLVIANRIGRDCSGLMSSDAFEALLGSPIDICISEDMQGAAAVASNALPLAAASAGRYRAQWRELAEKLGSELAASETLVAGAPLVSRIASLFRWPRR